MDQNHFTTDTLRKKGAHLTFPNCNNKLNARRTFMQ